MDDWQTKLTEVLGEYDERTEPFMEVDVHCSLERLLRAARAAGPISAELEAEAAAFAFTENGSRQGGGWGTYYGPMFSSPTNDCGVHEYPSLDRVTSAVLDYWSSRAGQAKHPVLRFRYAGLVWDLSTKVKGIQRRPELARMVVDTAVAIAELQASPHEFDVIQKLEWAHEVAVAMNDRARVETVRSSMVGYEERTAQDQLPGTWGRTFDLLVEGDNKRIPVADEVRQRLVAGMVDRLERLSRETGTERAHPQAVEAAALRLATHYRRRKQPDDVRRVLGVYATAYLRMAEDASGMLAAGWLQAVYDTLSDFGLRDEAEVVAGHYRRHAERTKHEMRSVSHTTSIPNEEIEAFLQRWTEGELSDLLVRLAVEFVPRRDEAEKQLREQAQAFPISHMISTSILDHDGRAVARIGPMDQDMEGHIVRGITQSMAFMSVFLRDGGRADGDCPRPKRRAGGRVPLPLTRV